MARRTSPHRAVAIAQAQTAGAVLQHWVWCPWDVGKPLALASAAAVGKRLCLASAKTADRSSPTAAPTQSAGCPAGCGEEAPGRPCVPARARWPRRLGGAALSARISLRRVVYHVPSRTPPPPWRRERRGRRLWSNHPSSRLASWPWSAVTHAGNAHARRDRATHL